MRTNWYFIFESFHITRTISYKMIDKIPHFTNFLRNNENFLRNSSKTYDKYVTLKKRMTYFYKFILIVQVILCKSIFVCFWSAEWWVNEVEVSLTYQPSQRLSIIRNTT